MKKKVVCGALLGLVLTLGVSISIASQSKLPFSDVTENNWYYKELCNLYERGIINGFEDGTFKGTSQLMKDQLLKLLVTTINPHGKYEKEENATWFKPYLIQCRTFGIEDDLPVKQGVDMEGNVTYYQEELPDIPAVYNVQISREEVAKYIVRTYHVGKTYVTQVDTLLDDAHVAELKDVYKDYSSISSSARLAVYECYKLGIMAGDDKGNFNPKGFLTRAEATAIIYRLRKCRDELVGLNGIDFDSLKAKGYISTNKNEETSAKDGYGVVIEEIDNTIGLYEGYDGLYTKAELDKIFASRESIAASFGHYFAICSDEELEELKNLYYTEYLRD